MVPQQRRHFFLLSTPFLSLLVHMQLDTSINVSNKHEIQNGKNRKHDDIIEHLISWLEEQGGTFSDKLEFRKVGEKMNGYGVFAAADLDMDEELIVIPRDALLTAETPRRRNNNTVDDHQMPRFCETIRALAREMRLGSDSNFSAYVEYLNTQSFGQIPSSWSDEGKQLLLELLGQSDNSIPLRHSPHHFRPFDPIDFLEVEWEDFCKGSKDPVERKAAILNQARGWDKYMVPIYEMLNHRNGQRWLNTKSNSISHDDGLPATVRASRNIKAGEELYNSYSHCRDCGNRRRDYGTPEILRDYGFVEEYPQRWILTRTFQFEIDVVYENQRNSSQSNDFDILTGRLAVRWLTKRRPSQGMLLIVQNHLERLRDLDAANSTFTRMSKSVPRNELETMMDYRRAAIVALEQALVYLDWESTMKSER